MNKHFASTLLWVNLIGYSPLTLPATENLGDSIESWFTTLFQVQSTESTPSDDACFDIQWVSPQPDQVFPAEQARIPITIALDPPLPPSLWLQLYLDGQKIGGPVHKANLKVKNLSKGTHQLLIHVINEAGQTTCTSAPLFIFQDR